MRYWQAIGDAGGALLRPPTGASCRRGFLALVGGMAMTAGWGRGAHAEPVPDSIQFRILREDSDIGRHEVRFAPTPDGLTVDSQVELEVKIAFITAFRYAQRGRDVWVGDKLVASDIVTDDDGERTTLQARASGESLLVDGAFGKLRAPLGTMTDISFWNQGIVAIPQLIDSKTGELGPLRIMERRSERVVVRGQEIAARGYAIESSQRRSGWIWYDGDGNWVKARLVTRGETLDYELI